MIEWLKKLFNKVVRLFRKFLKELFEGSTEIILASLRDIALQCVQSLINRDMSNEQKRKQAFDGIKSYAIDKGIEAGDHLINLAIELAVAYIKKIGN